MTYTMKALALAGIMIATGGQAAAQGEGTELAAKGLFLSRYVAAVAPGAVETATVEEVRVVAPRVRPADDLLQEISDDLAEELESEFAEGLAEVTAR